MISCVRRSPRRPLALAVLVLLALGASACITRPVKEKVFDREYTETYLRSEKRGTKTVAKGFDHPTAIAPVRLAHILSRIDMRQGEGAESKRVAAIPLETLFLIGDAPPHMDYDEPQYRDIAQLAWNRKIVINPVL